MAYGLFALKNVLPDGFFHSFAATATAVSAESSADFITAWSVTSPKAFAEICAATIVAAACRIALSSSVMNLSHHRKSVARHIVPEAV